LFLFATFVFENISRPGAGQEEKRDGKIIIYPPLFKREGKVSAYANSEGGEFFMGLLPIEWVKREKTTPSPRPRGASRPGRDSLGGKNPGFRSAGPASARHRFPEPFASNEIPA
jgi:hypothetical protein